MISEYIVTYCVSGRRFKNLGFSRPVIANQFSYSYCFIITQMLDITVYHIEYEESYLSKNVIFLETIVNSISNVSCMNMLCYET